MTRIYDNSNRELSKTNRLNFRVDDERMDQFQSIMDNLGLNKTEAFEYLIDIHAHAAKLIRDR